MTADQPWMKWYPADWRAETRLRMVSRAARSLWIDLLGLMHESVRYGYLLVAGLKPSSSQLAAVLGDKERDLEKWIAELEAVAVFSRTDDGVIYSRRMVRDRAKQELDRANGKYGGNPSLKGYSKGGVNPPHNGGDKAHMPEARDQRPDKSNKTPRAKNARSPKSRLPIDFIPDLDAAKSYWLGKMRPDLVERAPDIAAAFRDYHTAHGTKSESWGCSWRTWYGNALEFNRKGTTGNGRTQQSGRGVRDGAEHALATLRRAAQDGEGDHTRAEQHQALTSETSAEGNHPGDSGTDHKINGSPGRDFPKLSHVNGGEKLAVSDVLRGSKPLVGTTTFESLQALQDGPGEPIFPNPRAIAGAR